MHWDSNSAPFIHDNGFFLNADIYIPLKKYYIDPYHFFFAAIFFGVHIFPDDHTLTTTTVLPLRRIGISRRAVRWIISHARSLTHYVHVQYLLYIIIPKRNFPDHYYVHVLGIKELEPPNKAHVLP